MNCEKHKKVKAKNFCPICFMEHLATAQKAVEEKAKIINSICVSWGRSVRLISLIEERFKERMNSSISCNNCYVGLLHKIGKDSLVENYPTDLELYDEREKLISSLQKENEGFKQHIKDLLTDMQVQATTICDDYNQQISQLRDIITQQKILIKEMKCCGNCRNHYRPDLAEPCKTRFDFGYCDNWTSDGLKRSER